MTALKIPKGGIRAGAFSLRLPEPRDFEVLRTAMNDEALALSFDPPRFSDDELRAYAGGLSRTMAEAGQGVALMIDDADGTTIGGCSLWSVDWERSIADLGYWLLPAGRGRGAATDTARALTQFAHEAGIHRVQAFVHVGNEPSERVLERAGFTREGVLRSMYRRRGPRGDNHLFSHLPGE